MIIDLSDKTALVFGGSSGIGFATAKSLSAAGCSVIIVARNKRKLQKALKQLTKVDKSIHNSISLDLSKTNEVFDTFSKFFKTQVADIIVNNSSGPLPKDLLLAKENDFQKVFNQHFLSLHTITRFAIEEMKKRKYGRIINILGTSIKEPIPGLGLSSIKSITENWAKALSKEVGRFNITVNNILPGPTDTNELKNIIEILAKKEHIAKEKFLRKVESEISLRRIALPDEIANVILFIASDLSSYMTGSSILVDGGYTRSIM